MAEPFVGELKLVALNFAPRGWALCNGQLLPISGNQALFSLLGTTYGGNGTTNFALPNLRGRIPIGAGSGITQGSLGGEESHVLTLAELAAHSHTPQCSNAAGNQAGVAGAVWARDSASLNPPYRAGPMNAAMNASSVTATGAGLPHDNMQPSLVLNWIIALQGIFPSQP